MGITKAFGKGAWVALAFVLLLFGLAGTAVAQNTLGPGETLTAGRELRSPNGEYVLRMQPDGNLVLYDNQNKPVWESGTFGRGVVEAVMQPDGNLALKTRLGRTVWASDTDGARGARLTVQNDGNLVIANERGFPVWAQGNFQSGLTGDKKLMAGEFLRSENGEYVLRLQEDGNLVLYGPKGDDIWDSGTADGATGGAELLMQNDGNLVLRNAQGQAVWASDTDGFPSARLIVENDGRVVLRSKDNAVIWSNGELNPDVKPSARTTGEMGRQDDADSGRDAGSTVAEAIEIDTEDSPVTGMLDEADPVDMYGIRMEEGWRLSLKMVSTSTQNFDLALLDAQGNVMASSGAPMGRSEQIDFTAKSAGTYYLRVSRQDGEGEYRFDFSMDKGR